MLRNLVSKRNVFFVLLSLAAVTFPLVPGEARADAGAPFKGTFTVQFEVLTLSSTCAPGDTNCSTCINKGGGYVEAQGVGDTSQGTLFIQVLKCFNPTVGYGTYAGTFTMTAPDGKDSVTGIYSGQNDNAGDFYGFGPFSGDLKITGGTAKFAGAEGSAHFTAASGPTTTAGAIGPAGPISGSYMGMAFYSVQGTLELHENQ
jgi:hypothetical protein